jgi:hypothetical protein
MINYDKNLKETVIFSGIMAGITLLTILIIGSLHPEFYSDTPIIAVIVSIIVAYVVASLAYNGRV